MNQKNNFDFLDSISYLETKNCLHLDESTIRNLDLVYNFSTKSASVGTLFGVLNKTQTPMGSRFLRNAILEPLQDIKEIQTRQTYIEELLSDKILLDDIRKELKHIADIDAILNRIALNRASPRDLISLKKSLIAIVNVFEIIQKSDKEKLKKILKLS